jgi:membrane-associated phospholipid phosphatase
LKRAFAALAALASLAVAPGAQAACPRLLPWHRVGASLGHAVEPWPLGLAGFSPFPLLLFSPTGLDHDARLVAQKNLGGRYRIEQVSTYAPYVVAGTAVVGIGVSALAGACEGLRPFSAILQGMAGGLILTATLKWAVGRQWPNAGGDPSAPDRLSYPENAKRFRPFRFGFGAWPSGHTLALFAAAAAFRASENELGLVRFLGYPLALGVGAGMWLGDRHWASDIVSGAMLGEAIGTSVGRSFARTEDEPARLGSFLLVPVERGALAGWTGVW